MEGEPLLEGSTSVSSTITHNVERSCCTPVSVQFVLKRISEHSVRSSVKRIANGEMLFLMRSGIFLFKTCTGQERLIRTRLIRSST